MKIKLLEIKHMKYLIYLVYLINILLPFYTQFCQYYPALPSGCDDFGYLNMAKAISSNRLFKSHSQRPFDGELLDYLKKSKYPFNTYSHLIAPHAYHVEPHAFKVINTYLPGTSLMLSLFPIHKRGVYFAPICALIILMLLLIFMKYKSEKISFYTLSYIAIIMFIILKIPFFREYFVQIRSIAPTFGILITAGYLLKDKPNISVILLGLSSIFRITNVIFLIPFLYFYLNRNNDFNIYAYKNVARDIIYACFLILAGGLGIYFIYAWILTGNPFYPTYSSDNTIFSIESVLLNINSYLNFSQSCLRLHIGLIVILSVITAIFKIPRRWLIFSILISSYNYCFYIIHEIAIPYYPYASAMIILGIIIFQCDEKLGNSVIFRRIVCISGIIIALISLNMSLNFFNKKMKVATKEEFQHQAEIYSKCFSKYDVIWADYRSGTIEYATSKASFRYFWGHQDVKDDIMLWLKMHGYKQAIWKEELHNMPLKSIAKCIDKISLKYKIVQCPELGTIIEIK